MPLCTVEQMPLPGRNCGIALKQKKQNKHYFYILPYDHPSNVEQLAYQIIPVHCLTDRT